MSNKTEPIIVSYSELNSFRQCPHQWEKAYRERWTSGQKAPHFEVGTLFHLVLEEHYKAIRLMQQGKISHPELALYTKQHTAPHLWDESGSQSDAQEFVMWLYQGYCEMYADDAEQWKIINTEHEAVVPLPAELPEPGQKARPSNFHLKMKIDMIARRLADDNLYIWDHKTCSQLPTDKELSIDDQLGLYTWGMRELGRSVHGSIYNAVCKQRNKVKEQTLESRHSRLIEYRLDKELDTIAYEAYLTASRAYAIPPGQAERAPNPDTCRWKCSYLQPCLLGRKEGADRERQFLKDIGFVQNFTRH